MIKSLKLSTTTKIQNGLKICCMTESKAEIQEKININ